MKRDDGFLIFPVCGLGKWTHVALALRYGPKWGTSFLYKGFEKPGLLRKGASDTVRLSDVMKVGFVPVRLKDDGRLDACDWHRDELIPLSEPLYFMELGQ